MIVVVMFSNISRRYLENIFHNKLDIKNINKFIIDFFSTIVFEKINAFNARNIIDLVRNFDMYIYVVVSFIAQTTIKWNLYQVIILYRFRLMAMINYKTFASIRLYHEKFLVRIIRLDQDNSYY